MTTDIRQIITSSSKLISNLQSVHNLETECLFGEEILVNEIRENYAFCKCVIDNYKGWININELGNKITTSHKVVVIRSFIYKEPNIKSKILFNLPFGSLVKSTNILAEWAEIRLPNNEFGFIPRNHIIKKSEYKIDWVTTAKLFLNIPYKWGGRNSLGIDCSALVQLSLQNAGINMPRNSSDQEKFKFKKINNIKNLKKGCLIFWKGHVAIAISKTEIIHSNSYHMLTVIESLSSAVERIKNNAGPITTILEVKINN